MIESATGVVLRTHRLTESSLVVRWLTVASGRVSTVAKGARRARSPFAGKLDLFLEADFTFNRSRRSDLHVLREISVSDFHLPLREDVGRLQVAAYCTSLLEQATEPETPLPGLFELLTGLLGQLCRVETCPRLVFAFELKLLDALGLFPSLKNISLQSATRSLIVGMARGDWPTIHKLRPTPASVKELGAFLHGFMVHHLGRIPKSRGEALKAGHPIQA